MANYVSRFDILDDPKYAVGNPQRISPKVTDPEAIELWNKIMVKVTDKDGNVVARPTDSTGRVFAKKITEYMTDEKHIYDKFFDEKPKAQDIFKAAKFSKSKWGRIISCELADIERGNAFALAIALRLNVPQTIDLLYSAGIVINLDLDLDAAMMYFIEKEIYDMDKIYRILGQFCYIENGLDCFLFEPVTENQQPDYVPKKKNK